MSKRSKFLKKVLSGDSDKNIWFNKLCNLVIQLGFHEHPPGKHKRKFSMVGIEDLLNLQPLNDGKAKRYQVVQVRDIILKYKLGDNL